MERDTEIHMAGMIQRNSQIPTFRFVDELGRKMSAVELQRGLAESKGTAGVHERAPTFVQRTSTVDGSLQLGDGEVCAQCVPEHTAKDHASSDVEFLVPEVLNGEQHGAAERNQCDATIVVCGRTQEERETGPDSGGSIEHERDATRGEAASQQTMMNMAAVGAKYGLVTEKAARDGESGIEEGDG